MWRFLPAFLLLAVCAARAVIEVEPLSAPELEQRYRVLLEEMRCPKCQNQNLKDSGSPIATDLRGEIRRLLEEGRSDEEITAYLVQRYGDFVRYRPALKDNTLLLWFAPGLLALGAIVCGIVVVRRYRRSQPRAAAPLTDAEQRQLDELLDSGAPGADGEERR